MKRIYVFSILSIIFLNHTFLRSEINYLDPVPNSKFVNTNNSIIIGSGEVINAASLNSFTLTVTGSKSREHSGVLKLMSDGKKIIFKPDVPYALDEKVDVVLSGGLRTKTGKSITGRTYSFYTQTAKIPMDPLKNFSEELNIPGIFKLPVNNSNDDVGGPPVLNITTYNNPSSEDLFMSSFPTYTYIMISDVTLNPYFYLEMPANVFDFKEQPNGELTYYRTDINKFYEMNTQYDIVDSFYCGNGYITDLHEMRLLNNNHALILSYDPEPVDMSQIVPGGNPNAIVTGLIVQEVDGDNNVYFQWRSWDHYLITDATHEDLTAIAIDYVHGNAIEYDNDGNLLISARHMDEVTKVDFGTGEIIWRLGGKNNQFNFTNDPIGFSHQHAVRRIANGNITLFDNGNYHTPHFSRAVEYTLNETAKTATLHWQFRHTPDVYGPAMGYVERLENGNTLISWGLAPNTVTEVTPAGTIALDASFEAGIYTYRAFKYHWIGEPLKIKHVSGNVPGSFSLGQNYPNPFNPSTTFQFDVPKTSSVEITLFDINGKEIKTLLNKQMTAGRYSASFDGSGVSSGVYLYRIKAGDFMETKKMVLLK